MSARIPVTPDTAWSSSWSFHELDLAGAEPFHEAGGAFWGLDVEHLGTHVCVYPAKGIEATGAERDGDGWVWVVQRLEGGEG